jgi:hypothetical protein
MSENEKVSEPARPKGRRGWWLGAGVLLAVVAVAVLVSMPRLKKLSPGNARSEVWSHLKNKSGSSYFKPSIDFLKEKSPAQSMQVQYNYATNYPTVYRLIGEHLTAVDELFASEEKRPRAIALRMTMTVADTAADLAYDDWLAARICEGWLLPQAEAADDANPQGSNQIFQFVARMLARTGEQEREIEIFKRVLSHGTNNAPRLDAVRLRLADVLESQGRTTEAVRYLKQISNPRWSAPASNRVARLEQKLKK